MKNFDALAMIHPKDDRDINALLAEALAELRSINGHLDAMAEESPA